jgi:CTP-dependent riboflavin kinase
MQKLKGFVTKGFGVAGSNLRHVVPLIIERTGLPRVVEGTLNVQIEAPYIVMPDALITADEYDGREAIKLQRCRIRGLRAVIMRPTMHESVPAFGHGTSHVELLSHVHLRTVLHLADGAGVEVELEGTEDWWADDPGIIESATS